MATKLAASSLANTTNNNSSDNGKKYLKETNNIVDFDKEKERRNDQDDSGWDFGGGTINTNTLHKNDIKSGQLIDEISDLRDVLRRSVIGPLSREMIDISEDFTQFTEQQEQLSKFNKQPVQLQQYRQQLQQQQQPPPQRMNNEQHDIVDDAHGMSHHHHHIGKKQSTTASHEHEDVFYDTVIQDLNSLTTLDRKAQQQQLEIQQQQDGATVTITKEKLINLMKEYKKTKDDLKDHSSHIQEMDNQLNEVKSDLELKKKKIQLLKSTSSSNSPSSNQQQSKQQQQPPKPITTTTGEKKMSPVVGRIKSNSTSSPNLLQHQQQQQQQQQSPKSTGNNQQLNSSINNLLQTAQTGVITDDINNKIIEVLNTAKYRIERVQFKNRVLLTSSLHSLSTEIHSILERRITKRQVNAELRQNAQIVSDCDAIKITVANFMNELERQKQAVETQLEEAHKKKISFKSKAEKSRRIMELDRQHRQIESAISFLKIEKRSVRELRDRFVSVCNDVTRLYEACNTIERDLSKWDIELERIYLKVKDGFFSDFFKLHPVFQSCSARIKDHGIVKQDLVRELARREASRIASEIYVSGISQILECGTDLITDERMVDVARVRGLEHQVHMLYHSLHDQQTIKAFNNMYNTSSTNVQNLDQQQQQQQQSNSPTQHSPILAFNPQKNSNVSIGSNHSNSSSSTTSHHSNSPTIQHGGGGVVINHGKAMSPVIQHRDNHNSNYRSSSPIPISGGVTMGERSPSPLQQQQQQYSPNSFTSIASSSNHHKSTPSPPAGILHSSGNHGFKPSASAPKPLPNPHTYQQPQPTTSSSPTTSSNSYLIKPEQASPLVKPESIKPDSPSISNYNRIHQQPLPNHSPIISKSPPTPIVISAISSDQSPPSPFINKKKEKEELAASVGSLVMETMIKHYDTLFPPGQRNATSPIFAKTASYLDGLSDLSADDLIQSVNIASGYEGKVFSDSLKINGTAMKADQVDVYMTSELLKHFFKESPDPFISKQAHQEWLLAEKIEDLDRRLTAIRLIIIKLTDENRSILTVLLKTLNQVISKHGNGNGNGNGGNGDPSLVNSIARAFTCLILRY